MSYRHVLRSALVVVLCEGRNLLSRDASRTPESCLGLLTGVAVMLVLSFTSADGGLVLRKDENGELISPSRLIQVG